MGKYDPLAAYLEEDASPRITLSFAEIAVLVGGLPKSAFQDGRWWENDDRHMHAAAWWEAGYKVESVDLAVKVVTFTTLIPESTSEDVDGFLAAFYSKHYKFDYGDTTALGLAATWLNRHGDARAEPVGFDKMLFDFLKLDRHGKGERFALDRAGVSDAAIAYYMERAEQAADIAHRAVYGDFLLSIGHNKNRRELLARTIAAYLDACDLFLEEGAYTLLADALTQALARAAKTTHAPHAAESARAVLTALACRSGRGELDCSNEVVGWFITRYAAYREYVPAFFLLGFIERIVVTCDTNHFDHKEQGGLVARPLYEERHTFLALAVKLARKVQDHELTRHYHGRFADSHVAEAEWWATNGLGDAAYRTGRAYQDAAKAYIALGLAEKAARCQRLMQEAISEVPQTFISGPSSMQSADMAVSLARYERMTPRETFLVLVREPLLFPVLAEYKRAVIAAGQESPLILDLFVANYRDSLPAGMAETPEQKVRLCALRQLLGDFGVAVDALLVPVLDRLTADPLRFIGEMRERLDAAAFPSAIRIALCVDGGASYARGDHIAAVHTLIPQVEGMLRDLTIADGTHRFTYRKTTTRAEMDRVLLGSLIDDLRGYRPEDAPFFDLLELLLTDLLGDNLRNVVAHAFGDVLVYGKHNAAILILLLLRISFMQVRHPARPTM